MVNSVFVRTPSVVYVGRSDGIVFRMMSNPLALDKIKNIDLNAINWQWVVNHSSLLIQMPVQHFQFIEQQCRLTVIHRPNLQLVV